MYCELHATSAFSFLDSASLPEDLALRAAELGISAVALTDANGVYAAPRFFKAAKEVGVKPLVGAEISISNIEPSSNVALRPSSFAIPRTPKSHVANPKSPSEGRLTLLARSRTGYRNLCRLITEGAMANEKGKISVNWEQIALHSEGLHCLTGGDESPLWKIFRAPNDSPPLDEAKRYLERLAIIFPSRVHVELQRHRRRDQEHVNQALIALAKQLQLPLVATNGVRYAKPADKELLDVLTCIRLKKPLDAAKAELTANRERHLKGDAELRELFLDLPHAVEVSNALASELQFTLSDLGYQFPAYPLPDGESPISYLHKLTQEAAPKRFPEMTPRVKQQLERELSLIGKLDLAGYFLIVWDIVNFCRREKIMVQGRGSAANSAVCYALSITAVDPIKLDLLFERFLSEERGEWPDIDLDLPSGDQREKVIQYLYQKYGRSSAAMTANVITYRGRSAMREVGKAFGLSLPQVDQLAKHVGRLEFEQINDDPKIIVPRLAAAGFDPREPRMKKLVRMWLKIQRLPRHLGQHSGGMVIAQGRLDDIVPLEPAAMPGRVVVQWDKEDCADLGIIKVDLLGLGMLAAIEEALPMIERHEGIKVDMAHLPPDDPLVYGQIKKADTVGVFQLESRAQMASLTRHAPERFYDIVVQVAIIRPGPIVGGMVHPFFDRRQGKAPVVYPHPSLEPILKRTLGVPLFQEQVLRMSMVAAGFTGGQAEELRRAIGFKRSEERMGKIVENLHAGMIKNGIGPAAREEITKMITSFALYGFPESHAASFALIAYASAYLKAHHPAAFYASILNCWPMGFYHPATLVKDAQRHGVPMLPIDVAHSGWNCRWEKVEDPGLPKENSTNDRHPGMPLGRDLPTNSVQDNRESVDRSRPKACRDDDMRVGGVRIGLRYVAGLRESVGRRIEEEQAKAPFKDSEDLARRCLLKRDELTRLAHAGALASFGLDRRAALWQVAQVSQRLGPLFDGAPPEQGSPLPVMTTRDETIADYQTMHLTTGPHLMEHLRRHLQSQGIASAIELENFSNGAWVKTAGSVIVRQQPGTAKGFVFMTLEDETGMCQAIVHPDLFKEYRSLIIGTPNLVVEGKLQKAEGQNSVKAAKLYPLKLPEGVPSHDFY